MVCSATSQKLQNTRGRLSRIFVLLFVGKFQGRATILNWFSIVEVKGCLYPGLEEKTEDLSHGLAIFGGTRLLPVGVPKILLIAGRSAALFGRGRPRQR